MIKVKETLPCDGTYVSLSNCVHANSGYIFLDFYFTWFDFKKLKNYY